jgi:hypothetical protein
MGLPPPCIQKNGLYFNDLMRHVNENIRMPGGQA